MATGTDGPDRLLTATVRVLPARRREWGRAMQAELAAIDAPADRRSFARGCIRAAAAEFHLLRGAVHLLVVLATLASMLAWTATVGYPPLTAVLTVVVSILAVVCWEARRAGMLGPVDHGATAWLLRGAGYLIAAGIIAAGLAHTHPATMDALDDSVGVLVFATIPAALLIGLGAVFARRSAATARVLITGAGSGLVATLAWVLIVVVDPPIPPSVGLALAATGVAAIVAILANLSRSSTSPGCLLAGLLAVSVTMASIFAAVVLLAHAGPDRLIPRITPFALPADRISESRIEIVDPYVLLLVLSGLAATALALTAVVTRRPAPTAVPLPGPLVQPSGGESLG